MTTASRLLQISKSIDELKAGQTRQEKALQDVTADIAAMQTQLELIIDQLVPGPAVRLIFTADVEGTITTGVTKMNLQDSQVVTLSIQPADKKGNPAPVDGVPVWLSSNTELITVVASADGLSAVATAVGPLGTATVSVTADADLGAGTTELAGTLDITVISGAASTIKITAGTPTDQ